MRGRDKYRRTADGRFYTERPNKKTLHWQAPNKAPLIPLVDHCTCAAEEALCNFCWINRYNAKNNPNEIP